MFRVLRFSTEAKNQLAELGLSTSTKGIHKQVNRALGHLQSDPTHPSLNTHEFTSLSTKDRKVFEAYAQNNTPGAYRILWYYGPDERDPKTKKNICDHGLRHYSAPALAGLPILGHELCHFRTKNRVTPQQRWRACRFDPFPSDYQSIT
jgi:hypothetical protein